MSRPTFRVGPDEQARSLIAAMLDRSDIEWEIANAIREAIAEEREACAKVAESGLVPESNCAPLTPGYERRRVAAEIRART